MRTHILYVYFIVVKYFVSNILQLNVRSVLMWVSFSGCSITCGIPIEKTRFGGGGGCSWGLPKTDRGLSNKKTLVVHQFV